MPGLNLTREEAIQRADVIRVDHYDVELDLTRGDKDFFSRTTVTFSATEGETTFADLVSNNVHSIVLNGESLDPFIHQDHRIALPQLAAHNTLRVSTVSSIRPTLRPIATPSSKFRTRVAYSPLSNSPI